MLKKFFIAMFIACSLLTNAYAADMNSPVGDWVTISHETQERISIVHIWQQNGSLYGKVMKIFPGGGRDPAERCIHCEGALKNKPIVGMTVLWGFTQTDNGRWINGHALDPHTGNAYRGSMQLLNNGTQLELTGYWGIFWHTQTWIRILK